MVTWCTNLTPMLCMMFTCEIYFNISCSIEKWCQFINTVKKQKLKLQRFFCDSVVFVCRGVCVCTGVCVCVQVCVFMCEFTGVNACMHVIVCTDMCLYTAHLHEWAFLCAGLCRWLCTDGFVNKCIFADCGILWMRWCVFVVVHALV